MRKCDFMAIWLAASILSVGFYFGVGQGPMATICALSALAALAVMKRDHDAENTPRRRG